MASKEKLIAGAQKFLAKGQCSKAIGEFQKLMQAFPKDVRNRQKLAELLSREKRTNDALAEYEIVAKSYTDTGFYLKAIAVYKQMQKIDPARADFYRKLADLNEKQGLVGNALSEYRNLVAFYEKHDQIGESISILEKMLELDPDNLNLRAKLTESLYASDRIEGASGQLQSLVAALQQKQDYTKIIKLYDRLHDYLSADVAARLPLATALQANGQTEQSVQLLKKLLKDAPEDTQLLSALADGYLAAGDLENAKLTLRHLLKFAPQDLDCKTKLARTCLADNETERALEDLEAWKEEFLQAGVVPLLRELYEQICTELPAEPRAAATLASLYELTGGPPAAEKTNAAVGTAAGSIVAAATTTGLEGANPAGEEVASPDQEIRWGELTPQDSVALDSRTELELELELDLDLETAGPVAVDDGPESAVQELPLAEEAVAAQEDEPEEEPLSSDVELDLEIELDLGSLEDLASGEEDLERHDSADEAEPEPLDEIEAVDKTEAIEELEITDELEELEELEDFEELEELEDLDEIEEAEALVCCEEELPGAAAGDESAAVPLAVKAEHPGESPFPPELEAELEKAEFYLLQGLLDDAERILLALIAEHGKLPELTGALSRVQDRQLAAAADDNTVDFNDLIAAVNDDELFGAADFLGEDTQPSSSSDEFVQELATELATEDTESHYNLGIAYKEMGLFDDAVAEFDKAVKDPVRKLDCLTLKGQCALAMGEFDLAESTLRQALNVEGLSKEERVPLHYELGLFYQAIERPLEALENYQVVADHDLFFREVGEMVKDLRKQLGLDEEQADGAAQGSRDRVSYV